MARIMYIDPSTKNVNSLIKNLNKAIRSNNHVFLFLFMEGCGHCVRTKPEWKKIPEHLHHPHKDVILAEVDQALFSKLHGVGKEPMGYPCFRYIHGSTIEDYENSDMASKDRTATSFSKWIEKKSHMKGGDTNNGNNNNSTFIDPRLVFSRGGSRKRKGKGGKWSLKYKKSINCRRPKGFSQKQHCKSRKLRNK